jgi:hypothetical protein
MTSYATTNGYCLRELVSSREMKGVVVNRAVSHYNI